MQRKGEIGTKKITILQMIHNGLLAVIPESNNYEVCEVCGTFGELKDYKIFENSNDLMADDFYLRPICNNCVKGSI